MKKLKELEDFLKERIAILDGAMGTELQKFNLNLKCYEELNLKNGEIVKKIHLEYLKAGADIIETNTFNANYLSLKEYGLEDKVFEINKKGVEIAKDAIKDFNSKEKKFVAGSVGPTNYLLSFSKEKEFDEIKDSYLKQISGLLEGEVDLILIETIQDPLNAKAALMALKEISKNMEIPFVLSLTVQKNGKILTGQTIEAFVETFLPFNPFGFGINCALGPEDLEYALKKLSSRTEKPIFLYPNAGLPDKEGNYNYSPKRFSKILKTFAKRGFANVLGGCCGTNPNFIKELKIEIGQLKPKERKIKNKISLAGVEFLEIKKELKPIFVGERCNIRGSKEFKEAVLKNDWERAKEIGLEQVEEGSFVLDIFLEDVERSEIEDFKIFLNHLLPALKGTIMVDSKNLEVIEHALKKLPGRGIVNSVNLEDGEKFYEISKIAKKYGAFLVFQTISKERNIIDLNSKEKLKIASEGIEILKSKVKFPQKDIIFDPVILPLTLKSERLNHCLETLKTIKILKEIYPQNLTVLGISNVSFGFPKRARQVLNSVFLYYATRYGLDLAILNPKKIKRFFTIKEKEKELSKNLIFKRNKKAFQEFLDYFNEDKDILEEIKEEKAPEEEIKSNILKGSKKNLKENLENLLKNGYKPVEIIEKILLPSMEELGERFKKNEVILPEVLESASVTKEALNFLKKFMKRDYSAKAKILLATVKGDVHDIGKNLFGTLCENNGYEVIDLGVKVEIPDLIEGIKKYKPEVVGLSGLLTKSCFEMIEVAKEVSKLNKTPILLLGGAALTRDFVEKKIKPHFKGNLQYCSTAMEGLIFLNNLFSKRGK